MGDWTRKGPLEPAAPRGPPRGAPEFGERRPPRDPAAPEGKAARDLTWERRGPLAPLPQEEGAPGSRDGSQQRPAPEGLGERGGSYRGDRRQVPATWGESRPEGSRPRREYTERPERPERPERAPTAAEKDMQWRDRMRPDASQDAPPVQEGSVPGSPVTPAAAPAPAGRPRLNLQKRTVSEATDAASPTVGSDSKASPFGAARPIDTATREKEVEAKRQQAIREKREADEKAKEERRLAKEAAAKAEAEGKDERTETTTEAGEPKEEAPKGETEEAAEKQQNGEAGAEQKVPIRSREPREPRDATANPKSRAFETGNWRSASNDQRGPRGGPGSRGGRGGGPPRGPRQDGRQQRPNGPPSQQQAAPTDSEPQTPTQDEDGWTTVPKKGRQGRPVAS